MSQFTFIKDNPIFSDHYMRKSNNDMEGIIEDMRWMFMTRPSDKMLTSTSDLIEGVLFPIPTLR